MEQVIFIFAPCNDFPFSIWLLILEMVITHYRKILSSLYTKNLCHSISLPFQTEKTQATFL